MKKILLALIFSLICLVGYEQGAPVSDVRVTNSTTHMGQNIPQGWTVYDLTAKKLYCCDIFTDSTQTLTTAASNFTLINSGGINSLNGQSGATQTFVNGTNVTITSASNIHTIGWTGQLGVSKGGSGAATLTGLVVGNGTSPFTTTPDYHVNWNSAYSNTVTQNIRINKIEGDTAYWNSFPDSLDWYHKTSPSLTRPRSICSVPM